MSYPTNRPISIFLVRLLVIVLVASSVIDEPTVTYAQSLLTDRQLAGSAVPVEAIANPSFLGESGYFQALDNDDFNSATVINSLPYTDTINTANNTIAADDPALCAAVSPITGSSTTWYEFTPNTPLILSADTFTSNYDTILAVFTGSRGSLTRLDCNDDTFENLQSQISDLALAANTSYYIEVASYGTDSGGNLVLHISGVPEVDDKSVVSSASAGDACTDCIGCSVNNTQGTAGGPINTRTGGYDYTEADLSFVTSAGELNFVRTYSSLALGLSTNLSPGWTHNQDMRLIFEDDPGGEAGVVLLKSRSANQYSFYENANGTYQAAPGIRATLTKVSAAEYRVVDANQNIYTFDGFGRIVNFANSEGRYWVYTYNANGYLDRVTANSGASYFTFGYDSQGRITSVSDHTGRDVSFVYSAAGDLVTFTDGLNQVWTYTYDNAHHITQVTAPDQSIVERTEYDLQGRAVRQYDGESNLVVELTYNLDGTTTITDALGNEQVHTYTAGGVLVGETNGVGAEMTTEYGPNFQPTKVTNAAGHSLFMTWSADGVNLLSKTDPAGNITQNTYDSLNNLTSTTDPQGNTSAYTYSGKLLLTSTDSLNGITTYTYTPEGYLASVTDSAGRITAYTYNAIGQRASMTDPSGNTWTYVYDSLGRLTDTTDPRGRVSHTEYNAAGQIMRSVQNYSITHAQNDQNLYNIVTEYEYNARGKQVAVTDTFGRTTQYVYDDAGRLTQTIDALGNTTSNVYNVAGRLTSTQDALGNATTYNYDETGRLLNTINALGISSGTTTFDIPTNTSTVTNIAGAATTFHYDELGRVIKTVDALGGETTTTYDANGNVETRTDPLGRITHYEYDDLNRLIRTIDPNGGITETVYNNIGQRIASIDPLGNQTTYTYDNFGRLITTTDALGRETTTTYDQYGRRTASMDAAGNATTYTYDRLDRVIATTDPLGNATSATYNALGNVMTRTNANGDTTAYTYDDLNRVTNTTDANGHITTNAYDAAGNLISITNALGEATTYIYDALNRRTAVSDALGNTTHTTFNSLGQVSSVVDANGVITHLEYDALGRQIAVVLNYQAGVQPDAETNVRYEFGYNAVGNRVSVKDANGNITTYGYDALNRVTSKSDPLTNTWSYTYDLAGNRISATDAKNQIIQYTYDAGGQLTGINYPGTEPDVTFTYDLTGQRIGMTDGLGNTTWTYDNLNRPISVTDAFGKTVGYEYDAVGNRTELTHPDGKIVTYAYDDVNQLTGVTDWDNQNTGYIYDPVGQLSSISLPNGVSSEYSYNNAGRLTALQHTLGTNTPASYNYTYDPAGNLTQAVELVQNPGQFSSLNPGAVPVAAAPDLANPSISNDSLSELLLLAVMPGESNTDSSASYQFASYQLPEPQKAPSARALQQVDFSRLPLSFVPNFGQEDEAVRFQAQGLGGRLFFTPSEVVFALPNPVKVKENEKEKIRYDLHPANVIRIHYQGANENPEVVGIGTLPGVANYLIGNDPSKWRTDLPTYSGISYLELYPGVELRYEGTEGNLKSSYHVAPGTDPSSIVWRYKGAEDMSIDDSGNLILSLPEPAGTGAILIERAPVAWQEVDGNRVMVAAQYALDTKDKKDKKVNFLFPNGYDPNLPLVIDPTLTFSTYLGGTKTDQAEAIALDADGNIYITGTTASSDFPTVNPYQTNQPSNDVFVSKLNAAGNALLYSTYIGGGGSDHAWGIGLDSQGRITIVGETESSNFPTLNAYDNSYGAGTCESGPCDDVFVTQLSANGSALRYSTYLGGVSDDEAIAMALGSDDKIYLTGLTRSSTFPTVNGYDTSFGGGTCAGYPCEDVFVTKIDPALTGAASLPYSTFLGGSNYDRGKGIAVDTGGHVYVTGYTRSDTFPTLNPYQLARAGASDIVIVKLDTTLSGSASLLYGTYLGGGDSDHAHGIALNGADQVYITGYTESPDFPTQNPFDGLEGMCGSNFCVDAFVTHLDIANNTLVYSSYLGGSGEDEANSITVDSQGSAYITGYTKSTDFPLENEIQSQKGADSCSAPPCPDAFVAKVNAAGNALIYSTYLGGSAEDYGNSIAQDGLGGAYVTGYTYSSNFPTTPGAYDLTLGSATYSDTFVAKIFDPLSTPTLPLTIDYTYDALHRLKSAEYSDGRSFNYTYDANGNTLEASADLGTGAITTTYTYDAASQLVTAQADSTTWHYEYDANGSLTQVLPNGAETSGAKRYTYNAAGYLTQVESHNGTGWTSQAEMSYNGLGVRLTSSASGVTTQYASDGQMPLTITSGGNTTTVLYGLGPIAEKTDVWNYVLNDGINIPRQLTDMAGEVTLSVRYNPWGKPIETSGTGNFDASFIGTLIDATTGLIYIGNGQYYDPETGRFLTRGVNPNGTNPYVPWNPIGGILAPLGLASIYFSQRKDKPKPRDKMVFLAFMFLVFANLACCHGPEPTQETPEPEATGTGVVTAEPATEPAVVPPPTETPTEPPSGPTECVDCPATPSPVPTPSPSLEEVYKITWKEDGMTWDAQDKDSALRAVVAVAQKFTETLGGTAADAWARTYEYMEFQMGNCSNCAVGGEHAGYTNGEHDIDFAGISNRDEYGRNLVVHELGHAFKWLLWYKTGTDVYTQLTAWRDSHPGYPDRGEFNGGEGDTGPKSGFFSLQNQILWQVSLEGGDDEEFADQFLGWTFNKWETDDITGLLVEAGQARADMMNANMPSWVTSSAGP